MGAISLSLFKTFINETDSSNDALYQIYVDGANTWVETYTGMKFGADNFTDRIDGNAQLQIFTKYSPINSIASIEINTGTITTPVWTLIDDEYIANDYMIKLTRPLARGLGNYQVIYNAGYATIPSDIILATLRIAKMMLETSDTVQSESVGGDSITYKLEQSPDILNILSSYRNVY